ncbi:hypothetical protein MMC32_007430 [Xylographa parallela]|nr:hypothetical protein [Xylographa parallela]
MRSSLPTESIPASTAVIHIKAINTTSDLLCSAEGFVTPIIPGHEVLNLPTLCFLLENKSLGRSVLFDCGSRKDFWNFPPVVKQMLRDIIPGLRVEKGVDEILKEAEYDLDKLDSIIWSHWHWDHRGDAAQFPQKVNLVVGPGFQDHFMPGYPENPNSPILESETRGRKIQEIGFDSTFKLGQFPAHDFFGDGSFFLLDAPGHAKGHMCGLVRTTPDTFIFLGGDICHFSGMFRPSAQVELPDPVPATAGLDNYFPSPCPCSLLTSFHPAAPDQGLARKSPYYGVSSHPTSAYMEAALAEASINAMTEFDADPNVLVCITHDGVLLDVLPLLNNDPQSDIGDWKQKGYKERARWAFLNELPRNGKPGRKPLVEGLWKDGKIITV